MTEMGSQTTVLWLSSFIGLSVELAVSHADWWNAVIGGNIAL